MNNAAALRRAPIRVRSQMTHSASASNGDGSSKNSISKRIQHKVASKLSTRTVVGRLMPEDSLRLIDALHAVLISYYPQRVAEKVNDSIYNYFYIKS